MNPRKFFSLFLFFSFLLAPVIIGATSQDRPLSPLVSNSTYNDVSPALRDMEPLVVPSQDMQLITRQRLNKRMGINPSSPAKSSEDPVLQVFSGNGPIAAPGQNFEGIGNVDGYVPPDTQGDVGPNHYVQWINGSFAVFNKTGTKLYGPATGNTLWQGFGGPCQTTNDGDPITLYDPLADRWFMSQFSLPNYPAGPFYQCIAVSSTADPLGTWYRYQYTWTNGSGQDVMNDYPKFGVWPDGYYMSVNQFASVSGNWAGAGVAAFERSRMLNGQSAQMIKFDLFSVNSNFGSLLPADLDGSTPPPAGSPNYFVEVDPAAWIPPNDALRIWEFHVNWTTPGNSTFGLSGQPNTTLQVASFTLLPCVNTGSSSCIPQPGTSRKLDSLGDRLMHRLAYRNFGDRQSMVVNHTVKADGVDRAGIRWYELRNTDSSWALYQQGTYAPADGNYRWMGSIAMDSQGSIALGYSVSSSSTFPSIRYTGRLSSDPLGQMTLPETEIIAGGGSQLGYSRWGDYSMMSVDPSDDRTFWYTQEYFQTSSTANWKTRIASFRLLPSSGLPLVTTGVASNLTGTTATLNGSVNPNGFATIYYFEWGTTTAYGNTTSSQSAGSGTSDIATTAGLIGLTPNTLYHFRLVAINSSGTVYGSDGTFTTLALPGATTLITPSGTMAVTSPTYYWNALPNTTRYRLLVIDSAGTKVNQWYADSAAGCASGTGVCSATPSAVLALGTGTWQIQTGNTVGDGPWSPVLNFNIVASVPKGDFNGDGQTDLLWRNNTTGQLDAWYMNGVNSSGGAVIVPAGAVPLNWEIIGTGEFNNDGKTDLLWMNKMNGEVDVWYMNGVNFISGAVIGAAGAVPLNWEIIGTGDFNSDGKQDLLWRDKATGEVDVWYMNGVNFISGAVIVTAGAVPLNWEIIGTGDFNSDGKQDLLWRDKETGEVDVWYMNGVNFISGAVIVTAGAVPLNWEIIGTGDFNNDGKTDLLWRDKTTGEVDAWYMNGVNFNGGAVIVSAGAIPLNWEIIAP